MKTEDHLRHALDLLPLIGRGASWADAEDAAEAGHKALVSLRQRLEKLEGALRALLEGRGCDAIFCHLHRGREGTPSRFPPGYCPDCLARDLIDLLARQPPDTQEEERK